ncbi:MAG: hypothetical protein OEW00_08475 [candidate division Zixibacteria bacterium]|nr:hypothetical protein [candidate division Zixibacteria bacterium]
MAGPYRGKNRYPTFLKAGKTIAAKVSRLQGVVGILGTGSIGRRFGDEFSDLDLTVYAHSDAVKRLGRLVGVGWTGYKGVSYDIPVVSYEKALKAGVPSAFWSQIERWHQENSQILFDTDNRVKRLLQQKLVYADREQKKLMRRYHEAVHEHLVFFPELWAKRGHLYNVIDALTRGVTFIVLWIYAKNRVFEPYMEKWPFYHLEMKNVPEYVHLEALTEIYTRPLRTVAGAMRIRRKLLDLCDQIGLQWEVYSCAEAHQRCEQNWGKVSEETKRLLSW